MTAALALPDRLAAAIGRGVVRVLGVARQAVVTTFREGLLAAYREARDPVTGWRWEAEAGACPFCRARHGKVYGIDEPFVSHPNCKCVLAPVRRGELAQA